MNSFRWKWTHVSTSTAVAPTGTMYMASQPFTQWSVTYTYPHTVLMKSTMKCWSLPMGSAQALISVPTSPAFTQLLVTSYFLHSSPSRAAGSCLTTFLRCLCAAQEGDTLDWTKARQVNSNKWGQVEVDSSSFRWDLDTKWHTKEGKDGE